MLPLSQVVDGFFDAKFENCLAHQASKKSWKAACWRVLEDRLGFLDDAAVIAFPEPAQPVTEAAAEAEEETPGGAASSSSMPAPAVSSQQREHEHTAAEKEVHVDFVKRVWEESNLRDILDDLQWLDDIPQDQELDWEMQTLRQRTREFVDTFTWHHCKRFPVEILNARLVTVETRRSFDHLAALGKLPRNLTNPRDRHIRGAASTCCSPFYQDPGNFKWDVILHVLSLHKYVSAQSIDAVIRTAPAEYGDRSNCSAKGPVNLRGNILEALLYDLQNMSSYSEAKGSFVGPTKGASHR